jgi:hypothetical protein
MSQEPPNNFQQRQNVGNVTASGNANVIFNQTLQITEAVVKQRPFNSASPYRSLKRFNFNDKDLFFGRDQLIAELLEAIEHKNLILVSGASGSGKSSVIRAGVIPELRKQRGNEFQHFIFTPDLDPFESFYRSLRNPENEQNFSESDAEVARLAKEDTLTQAISSLKQPGTHWLITIDQFEELFTICKDLDKRKAFIEGLVVVKSHPNCHPPKS